MSDETQKRLITILATAIAYVLASRLAKNLFDEPEVRGVRDDFNEALLHAAFSVASTVIASLVIRRLLGSRWGS